MMEMFNKIAQANLTPNEFYLLYCIRESVGPLNINLHKELHTLQQSGWLSQDNQLQPKAVSILAQVESFFKIHKKKTSTQLLGKDFLASMIKYNELFPKRKAGSGKYMRSNIKNVETKFRWFFDNYTYTWEVILEATARYMDQQLRENYKFTRTSMYFICKSDKGMINSDLADWCEIVSTGDDTDEPKVFKEKVV